MKEIKFSTANHPDQWWADDYGGVIRFASAVDAKAAERLFNALAQRTEAVAPIITDLGKAYADDCAAMAPYIRHDAPKRVKEIALGWREDDEREPA